MARNVTDLALLFDAMCEHEPSVPLSLPAPVTPFGDAARSPLLPGKIAFSMDLGITPVDPEVRMVVSRAMDSLSDAGYQVVETHPDFSGLDEIFHVLRAQNYAAGLGYLLEKHEGELNPNVAWNIREGLKLTVEDINQAEAARVALVSRVQTFFSEYPVLLTPATIVPPYPVSQDHVAECDGHPFDNYYQWLAIAYAFTTALCPALSLPCGFTRNRLPVGLQIAAATQADATVIAAAAKIEQILELDMSIPINPRPPGGTGSEQ
jgi:amidase